ncbi:hypothetical protein CEUSTIGMA_g11746.t1 [Chlamydomonas eustigma]|uniref:rRNA biogenesis protein RRP36 n=1 Tax=Chlamydomonas eustigma TaxID=1157962 RepID=A0A250XML0_9CHLO|nr:hypothetical protein CEUSTIGMA_g11746.t1 [Chlamydomonas eustigma]|eukprot:GAX84324.1 hypothetical protein CEUSTIGMA_g11746.t1 [Chlamydomonas eustigma]
MRLESHSSFLNPRKPLNKRKRKPGLLESRARTLEHGSSMHERLHEHELRDEEDPGFSEEDLGTSFVEDLKPKDESDLEDQQDDIMQKVASEVPFEVLEALKVDGRGPVGHAARLAARAAQEREFHRANRHRPSEISSKKPVSRHRDIIQITKREAVDPRFQDSLGRGVSGTASTSASAAASKSYAFLYDEVMQEERKGLKEKLKKEKNPKFKARIQAQLTKLEQTLREEQSRRKRRKIVEEVKASEKKAVAEGKKPFYIKKSEQRKLELLAQYQELKDTGGLDKFMEKRRRKNASKDHRYVPSQRRNP